MTEIQAPVPIGLCDGDWYVAADVARAVGYRDAHAFSYGVPKDHVKRHVLRTSGGSQSVLIVSKPGLIFALGRSRRPEARTVAERMGLGMVWASPIETESLRVISAALAHMQQSRQHQVGPYRIDLYFPQERIAVECDEMDHADKDRDKDRLRQASIEQSLKCRFVRFNPHAPGFNVGEVINQILVHRQPSRRARPGQEVPGVNHGAQKNGPRFLQARLQLDGVGRPPEVPSRQQRRISP